LIVAYEATVVIALVIATLAATAGGLPVIVVVVALEAAGLVAFSGS
jgi:hypothetical protein